MDEGRRRVYRKLRRKVGRTPLYEISHIPIPRNNRILAKEEFRNSLSGSHYDRVYVDLLEHLESKGKIAAGRHHLIETTSGNAGTAFAAAAQILGYEATVIIPHGVPRARIDSIRRYAAHVVQTPEEKFMEGAVEALERTLVAKRDAHGRPYYCPNHSRETAAVKAMAALAEEVLDSSPIPLHLFVAAVGNGLSILGPGRVLKERGLGVLAWDPVQAPTCMEMKYPGRYRELFGVAPGALGHHRNLGTGVLGIEFPFLREAVLGSGRNDAVVDDVVLAADEDAISSISALVDRSEAPERARRTALELPYLTDALRLLAGEEKKSIGFSSAGSLAVALARCKEVADTNLLIIFYDHASNYIK